MVKFDASIGISDSDLFRAALYCGSSWLGRRCGQVIDFLDGGIGNAHWMSYAIPPILASILLARYSVRDSFQTRE